MDDEFARNMKENLKSGRTARRNQEKIKEIKKMFGLESQVMLLAAVNDSQVSLLHPGKELPTGTIIM